MVKFVYILANKSLAPNSYHIYLELSSLALLKLHQDRVEELRTNMKDATYLYAENPNKRTITLPKKYFVQG